MSPGRQAPGSRGSSRGSRAGRGILHALRNFNVALALAFRLTDSSLQGLWNYSTLTNFVYLLCKSSKYVGIMQGIQGTCLVLAALPAGWLADRTRRDRVLRVHGCLGLLAIATTVAALLLPPGATAALPVVGWRVPQAFLLLCVGSSLFGFSYAGNPVVEALFADSSPTGTRSLLYVVLYAVTVLATSLGPALAALMFALRGNNWELEQLRPIILAGLSLSVVPMLMLFFFDDSKALGDDSEAVTVSTAAQQRQQQRHGARTNGGYVPPAAVHGSSDKAARAAATTVAPTAGGRPPITLEASAAAQASPTPAAASASPLSPTHTLSPSPSPSPPPGAAGAGGGGSGRGAPTLRTPLLSDSHGEMGSGGGGGGGGEDGMDGERCRALPLLGRVPERLLVPGVMTASDLLFGLASGMTIRFMSVWFQKEVGLDPVRTNAVMAVTPLALSAMSLGCQRLSRRVGRVAACLACRVVGVALITWMGWQPSMWRVVPLVIPVYIVRTAIMNASYPVQRSILMDYVAKADRAKWSSLEAVMQFGWSGSAVVGGVIIDRYGFDSAFVITGIVQAVATCVFSLLLLLVPREESPMVLVLGSDDEESALGSDADGSDGDSSDGDGAASGAGASTSGELSPCSATSSLLDSTPRNGSGGSSGGGGDSNGTDGGASSDYASPMAPDHQPGEEGHGHHHHGHHHNNDSSNSSRERQRQHAATGAFFAAAAAEATAAAVGGDTEDTLRLLDSEDTNT